MPLTLTRSLLVVLVPGLVALAPWLLWLVREFGDVAELYREFPQAVAAACFAAVVVVGSTIENVNSYIEDLVGPRAGESMGGDANWYVTNPHVTAPFPNLLNERWRQDVWSCLRQEDAALAWEALIAESEQSVLLPVS